MFVFVKKKKKILSVKKSFLTTSQFVITASTNKFLKIKFIFILYSRSLDAGTYRLQNSSSTTSSIYWKFKFYILALTSNFKKFEF